MHASHLAVRDERQMVAMPVDAHAAVTWHVRVVGNVHDEAAAVHVNEPDGTIQAQHCSRQMPTKHRCASRRNVWIACHRS